MRCFRRTLSGYGVEAAVVRLMLSGADAFAVTNAEEGRARQGGRPGVEDNSDELVAAGRGAGVF